MRIHLLLRTLTSKYRVSYLNLGLYLPRRFNNDLSLNEQGVILENAATLTSPYDECTFARERFDILFIERLISFKYIHRYFFAPHNDNAVRILDCDDYESQTRVSFSHLARTLGHSTRERSEQNVANWFAKQERAIIPQFHHVLMSSADDVTSLSRRFPKTRFHHVPNGVTSQTPPPARLSSSAVFTILFVGTMDYYPNADGIVFFCTRILTSIRRYLTAFRVRVLIVGSRPTIEVKRLEMIAGVRVTGEVDDVLRFYSGADVAIVPIRAGGGSRIKILEAFACQCPVVSTHAGASGLTLVNGRQLLIGDTPEEFARACISVLTTPNLRDQLVKTASTWLANNNSAECTARALLSTLSEISG